MELSSRHKNGRTKTWTKPHLSTAHSSTQQYTAAPSSDPSLSSSSNISNAFLSHLSLVEIGMRSSSARFSLPMLSSHCPGFVCYAEKNQPECIPYLNTVKSAQQMIGCLLKQVLPKSSSNIAASPPKPYFHVSVQPCFDKKLEASRKVKPNT